MSNQVNLADVLSAIGDSSSKLRLGLLEDLKYILQHNHENNSLEPLNDAAFQHIFETLFKVVSSDRTAYLAANKDTIKKTVASRLSTSASTLRFVVSVSLRTIKSKTVRFVLGHLLSSLTTTNGFLCEPLAVDYVKAIGLLLSHQPHVEHLQQDLWDDIVSSGLQLMSDLQDHPEDEDDASSSLTRSRVMPQASSARPRARQRVFQVQVAGEMLACIRSLVTASTLGLYDTAPQLLSNVIRFLDENAGSASVSEDAFGLINGILVWARTENVELIKSAICHLLRLVKKYWRSHKQPTLKDAQLILLINVQPFVSTLISSNDGHEGETASVEIKALHDIILEDYTKKPERDQLQQEDIRLKLSARKESDRPLIKTTIFELRGVRGRAEHNWAVLSLLAQWTLLLSSNHAHNRETEDDDDADRYRKRVRLMSEFDELQTMFRQDGPAAKITALQLIAFVGQIRTLPSKWRDKLLATTSQYCLEESTSISSWAFLAAASLVSTRQCNSSYSSSVADAIWQGAVRSMTNSGACRAACHYLYVISRLERVSQTTISELVQRLAASLDLSGPAILSDSSADLLRQVLLEARTSLPALANDLSQRILAWFTKKWVPSKFELRTHLSLADLYDISDLRQLVCSALDEATTEECTVVYEWGVLGAALIHANDNNGILAYLLLEDINQVPSADTVEYAMQARTSNGHPSIAAQAVILGHLLDELPQVIEAFNSSFASHARNLTTEACKFFCGACHLAILVSHDLDMADTRRSQQLQSLSNTLLENIEKCASSPECNQGITDMILRLSAQVLYRRDSNGGLALAMGSTGATLIAKSLLRMLAQRQQHDEIVISQDQSTFATDAHGSQDSRRSSQAPAGSSQQTHETAEYGSHALRCTVSIHSLILAVLDGAFLGSERTSLLSQRITQHLGSAPNASSIYMLRVLSQDITQALDFTQADVETILASASKQIISTYTHARSTLALSSVVDFMVKTVLHWTDASNRSLSNLGLDVYEWFINLGLTNRVLAPAMQQKIADLLLAICRHDPDYGSQTTDMSARTSLFKLLRKGPISVQFYLAPQLSSIFKLYSISTHDQIFDDLQRSLPVDTAWAEGIAMRLFILAELGSTWQSLLRICVYYIFETAGQVTMAVPFAKRCVARLTSSLSLDSSVKLFALFCPQLLHTWLEGHSLQDLPYAIFDYASVEGFLSDNEDEITAQLFLRDRQEELDFVSAKIGKTVADLLIHAVDRTFAYAIGQDTTIVTASTRQATTTETRLRETIGKEKLKKLTYSCYGAIVGRILLATHREESDEKWLERDDSHKSAATALSSMKKYSQSTRAVPPSHEPHFTSKYLLHQLGRLARRIGQATTSGLWNASSYTLASQMLLDSIDSALGSLHSCAVFQKLRLLIALAEQTPLEGYPLEHTLRLLLPFVDDEQCADDVIGILHYLLGNGVAYLSEHWTTLWSVSIQIVLRLTRFDSVSQQTPTQTSQQRETLARMQKFRLWLLAYLENITTALPARLQTAANTVRGALASSTLPGNARSGSSESALILLLLDQEKAVHGLLGHDDAREAIRFLANGFEIPTTYAEDCLSDDVQASTYVRRLWDLSQRPSMDDGFVLWSALVAGRAFAATGSEEVFKVSLSKTQDEKSPLDVSKQYRSQRKIAEHLQALLRSNQAQVASIALSTLRACMVSFKSEAERLAFQRLFPPSIIDAIVGTSSQYHKASLLMPITPIDKRTQLESALAVDAPSENNRWITNIALSVCDLSHGSSLLSGLSLLLNNDSAAARSLLPSIIHLVLLEDSSSSVLVREALSSSIRAHLSTQDDTLMQKQSVFVELLLYLLNQVYPREATQMDRLKWLDCDYLVAAECAVRCQMPTTALMLAEMARSAATVNRRASGRVSSTLPPDRSLHNALLVSVFQQVSEPDSYYGVEQSASLQSFLQRSEYEGNDFQALVSRSAQLDNNLRITNDLRGMDTSKMMKSLSALNLNSLTLALAQANLANAGTSAVMLDTARLLQQWDINIPEHQESDGVALYRAFGALNHATEPTSYVGTLKGLVLSHAKQFKTGSKVSLGWASALASMTEIMRIVTDTEAVGSSRFCDLLHRNNMWMELADFNGIQTLVTSRSTIAGVLLKNKNMMDGLQLSASWVQLHEAKSIAMLSDLARKHDRFELAMSAAWQLNSLAEHSPHISSMAQREVASVLCSAGDSAASIRILRELATSTDVNRSSQIGQAGLLSQIGQQLADARLEAPSDILQNYLEPSIEHLQSQTGVEAGEVFYTFAAFCDAQLRSVDALAEFQRLSKLRQAKYDEAKQLEALVASTKRSDSEHKLQKRSYERAMQWYEIDNAEFTKVRKNREVFAEQSLKNYMHTLRASDKHDLCVLRWFALWLEYSDSKQTQAAITKHLSQVPTWKFVLLMNQLMSRLKGDRTEFDKALLTLLQSVCRNHPYHTVHHLYAARKFPGDDPASQLRRKAAERLCEDLVKDKSNGDIIRRMLKADSLYKMLAQESRDGKNNGQYSIDESHAASRLSRTLPKEQVPPATVDLALQPDAVYKNVPVVTRLANTLTIMTGISAPKVLTIYTSDGKQCKQLFKGGNDDLRQDAIMEQVFGEVSKMLRNHKASRQRNLHIRTYKVIPLTNRAGIIEFVPNSMPINDFLQPAHLKYHPNSMKVSTARQKIGAVVEQSTETRVKEFRKVCEQMPPVMRHFFFERFKDPDEWFARRTAYTRTTAAISMLGQILGLGDRHCHNILLDERSGEVIHIDLGVAFEAGRVLPIPELVPFRLTRDIIDGMGVTGTEGIFKRCAEFTLDALRKDKDGIMTLLNVLRYDPLYSWTLSPIKVKRMQQQEGETNGTSTTGLPVSSKTESEAGEAERALSIVEKKLGNALSTAASVSEMIQQATDDRNLATLFSGWSAFF